MSEMTSQNLDELKTSILFAADFPKRTDHPSSRGGHSQNPAHVAIERARGEYRHLATLIKQLGEARYLPAIPTLAQLWRECALVPVRQAAGHALFKMRRVSAQRNGRRFANPGPTRTTHYANQA
jgi:hypothetical protein